MKKFKLSHLVLYSKGWYERTDDVWEDLKKILALDDYTPFTKSDVYTIIAISLEKAEFDYRFNDLRQVLDGIHPLNCWKYGYYTNTCDWVKDYKSLPEYDMPTAFIYYVIYGLKFIPGVNYEFAIPKYKLYPKPKDIPLQRVIEHFNIKKPALC